MAKYPSNSTEGEGRSARYMWDADVLLTILRQDVTGLEERSEQAFVALSAVHINLIDVQERTAVGPETTALQIQRLRTVIKGATLLREIDSMKRQLDDIRTQVKGLHRFLASIQLEDELRA